MEPSTISHSTRSRRYTMNTSIIAENLNNNNLEMIGEGHQAQTFKELIDKMAMDIGRCDYKKAWISILSLAIFPIFQILTSFGADLYNFTDSNTSKSFINIVLYVTEIIPNVNDILVMLILNLFLSFVYIYLACFFVYTVYKYKEGSYPSTNHVTLWLFAGRCVASLFTCYFSFLTCKGFRLLLMNEEASLTAVHFGFGLPLLVVHMLLLYLFNSIWHATPIIRKNDKTQLWYCFSELEFQMNLVILYNVFVGQISVMVGGLTGSIVFTAFELVIDIYGITKFYYHIPFVQPGPNAFFLSILIESAVIALNPVLFHFLGSYFTFIIVADIILYVIIFYLSRFLVSYRVYSVYSLFRLIHEPDEEEEEEEGNRFNLASYPVAKAPNNVNYQDLCINSPSIASLFMRVGYMYNINDVNELEYVRFAVKEFATPDIVFSAAQIALSVETNHNYIGEIEKICAATKNKLPLSGAFISLLNEVRQGLLTQTNKPLTEAIRAAKKANTALQSVIGDFWGAVLKQKIEAMTNTIPTITAEMDSTTRQFQRLARNYTMAQQVFREISNFYHKSLGEHKLTLEFKHQYDARAKRGNRDFSASTTTSQNYEISEDNTFAQHIEPSIAAQDVIEQTHSRPSDIFLFTYIITFIILIAIPITVLTISVIDMRSFAYTFEPVNVFSETLYSVTRIPQLVRRRQLFLTGEILPHQKETGPVRGTNLEFIPGENIIEALKNYTTSLKSTFSDILVSCKTNDEIQGLCSDKIYKRKTGSTTANASSYDILTSFTNAAEKLIELPDSEWKKIDTVEDAKFIFDNFDVLTNSFSKIMTVTTQQILSRKDEFAKKALILYILTWVVPVVVLLPLTFYSLYQMKAEITFLLKMFFCFPKNEISSLRWSMKANKVKGNKKDNNKLQRNQLASDSVSSTEVNNEVVEQVSESLAGSSRTNNGMYLSYIKHTIFFGLISCIVTTIGVWGYQNSMLDILNSAYGYVMAVDSTASAVASYVWVQELFSKNPIENLDIALIKTKASKYVNSLEKTFDSFLYGTTDGSKKAGLLLGEDIVKTYIQSTPITKIDTSTPPANGFIHSAYFSLSCDSQLRLLTHTSNFILNASNPGRYSFDDEFTYNYEHLIFSHLDYCLNQGQFVILTKTYEIEQQQLYLMLILFISLFTFQIMYYFTVNLLVFIDAKQHHKTVKRLLLLIPPEAMLKGQLVIKWVSGSINYRTYNRMRDTGKSTTGSTISQEFIVNNSRGGLILTDADLKITLANTTVCTMFKLKKEEIIGKNLIQLFQAQLIDKDKIETIAQLEKETMKMKAGRSHSNTTVVNSCILGLNNQLMYIQACVVGHADDSDGIESNDDGVMGAATSYSVVIQDRTSEHFQEALVASEKAKGEKLIESLLPPSIIKRMNDGETDITFEVQQATCLFTSIVGWADLTKHMSATKVVGLLNELFCAYDEELHNYQAITKVKTIGHIYMCCGGLFSDSSVNSAQVVVEYAVKLLEISQNVSKNLGIPFQITCGVNTGGPLKCGILGVTRPVFDIIGDVVNVSSRMNSHCLPGYIQVSPTTYDAIKFLQFNIKERGEIQVKGKGMLKTYLVSPQTINSSSNQN